MLSVQLVSQAGRNNNKLRLSNFNWLDDIPADDWPVHFRGQHGMPCTLRELALRSGMEKHDQVVDAFQAWALAHGGRCYALLWSHHGSPRDAVMIAMCDARRTRRRVPARDPQAEGWMW